MHVGNRFEVDDRDRGQGQKKPGLGVTTMRWDELIEIAVISWRIIRGEEDLNMVDDQAAAI